MECRHVFEAFSLCLFSVLHRCHSQAEFTKVEQSLTIGCSVVSLQQVQMASIFHSLPVLIM